MSKVGQKLCVWARKFYQGLRINRIPLGGVNVVLISGLRPTVDGYITIFQADLAGNKKLIELGYEIDIMTFNLLFKLQIDSRYMQSSPEKCN